MNWHGNKIQSPATFPWRGNPSAPVVVLADHHLHIWKACLDVPAPVIAGLKPSLSSDELERAGKFHFDRDRDRFIVGRGLLRQLLGSYLDRAPRRIRFIYNASGKPYLDPLACGEALHFNVSHSNGWALFAITRQEAVGIDLEQILPDFPINPISDRFFTSDECEAIRAAPASGRARLFFQLWVRKEARVKALGLDVWASLRQGARIWSSVHPATDLNDPVAGSWYIHDLSVHPGYVAAVAIKGKYPGMA